jgi:hypothetical protein
LIGPAGSAFAEDRPAEQGESWRLADHFTWDLRAFAYGIFQQQAESTQNPLNRFLDIQNHMAIFEARPDLRLSLNHLELSAKPRVRLSLSDYSGNMDERRQWEGDWRFNEWLARFRVREDFFVSYGRENLQWGPSFLFSPSNPFFLDNGRRNTYMEVPGMDFGRAVWLPNNAWSISFIANTGEGANEIRNTDSSPASILHFSRSYAIKTDYAGREKYASFIISKKENGETAFGFYGGWTFTDAILLYAEGAVTRGTRALYPEGDQLSPFGFSMEMPRKRHAILYPVILTGGSYTFMSKGALAIEYAYYRPGYNALEADRYYALRSKAASALQDGGAMPGLAQQTLGMTALTGLRFLRRNYAMVQYSQPEIANRLDLTFRWTQNLDDGSGQLISIISCSFGKHVELYSVGTFMIGIHNGEFTSILHNQLQLGLQYTF